MTQTLCAAAHEQVVDTMIDLARLSTSHRIVVGGADGLQVQLLLHRRGLFRTVTATAGGIPRGQCMAGLIAGDRSYPALEASLVRVAQSLNATASIVVSIDPAESGLSLKVRGKLEQFGFRIEAGVRCQQGFVLAAYRCNFGSIAKAA